MEYDRPDMLQPAMRRLVYLMIKALCEQTKSEEVLVVTASLCQDINSKIDTFRSNAIRVLAKVLDVRLTCWA